MGSCIICGTSVDGHICSSHEEDVVFEFRGTRAGQLTPGRFYRGSVDGYADFGVFVDIGDSVTGLLHRSELDKRLESLDWEAGDEVFVQVKNIRDNGNVDLGWSIRQGDREFRGVLIDDPAADHEQLPDEDEQDAEETDDSPSISQPEPVERESEPSSDGGTAAQVEAPTKDPEPTESVEQEPADEEPTPEATETAEEADTSDETPGHEYDEAEVGALADRVGDRVRLEGEIATARQTSGPTVFELRDGTGTVDCAAFEEAGVRAYPEIDEGDVVRLDGEVRERRGELQVETEALVALVDEEHDAVATRIEDALHAEARPDDVEPLAADEAVEALADELTEAATAIRRAVFDERPVIVRHSATADGYAAGVAIERAALPLVREEHDSHDAEYHYFDRRPLEDGVYDMDDATADVTRMLDNRERHDEKLPLFVFVAAGGTRESLDGFEMLGIYGANRVVVDGAAADAEVGDTVESFVAPATLGYDTTSTALAASVAAQVNGDVREDLLHLPAVSFWEDTPEAYVEAAEEAGYDLETAGELREAVALEAFYQSYEDKRELIADILFADEDVAGGLAGHVSEQFRDKLGREVETAEANLEFRDVEGEEFAVLDTEAYTHEYEFPPTELLLDALFRDHREDVRVLVGIGKDELHVRSTEAVDVHAVTEAAREVVPDAGLDARSARRGRIEFLSGERADVLGATIDAIGAQLD
jgi:RecJ-like exonuclease